MLAIYELYAGVPLDINRKAWVGKADVEMAPAVTEVVRAAHEAVNTSPLRSEVAWLEGGDCRLRESKRNQDTQLSTGASQIVCKRADVPIWTQRRMQSVEKKLRSLEPDDPIPFLARGSGSSGLAPLRNGELRRAPQTTRKGRTGGAGR